MISFFDKLTNRIKYNVVIEWYNFLSVFGKKQQITPHVMSIDQTIETIVATRASVSRFGDGEVLLIGGERIGFQQTDSGLSTRLAEVLGSNVANHIVCLSDVFVKTARYNRRARRFWNAHFYLYGYLWDKYLQKEKVYGNTFMTRPYMDFEDKSLAADWFVKLKSIWEGREIVFIEGEKSRLGVGNDLFDNVQQVQRILCKSTSAFDQYDVILQEALKLDKDKLILVALGPTATVLSYDLCRAGYQAIDVGHIDIEYEWFLMGVKRKVNIASKYVNEVAGGDSIITQEEGLYQSQVIAKLV